ETLGVGVRFDLRLAVLLMLPAMLLAWLPFWNSVRSAFLRGLSRLWLVLAVAVVLLMYFIDFGHYAYLGVRLNASALKFLGDVQISQQMLWESYPVVWISLAWIALLGLSIVALLRLERVTLDRPGKPVRLRCGDRK